MYEIYFMLYVLYIFEKFTFTESENRFEIRNLGKIDNVLGLEVEDCAVGRVRLMLFLSWCLKNIQGFSLVIIKLSQATHSAMSFKNGTLMHQKSFSLHELVALNSSVISKAHWG